MNLRRMFMARLRYSLRSVVTLFFVAVAALLSVLAATYLQDARADALPVAVVMEDTGAYGEKLLCALQKESAISLTVLPREAAMRLLRQDRLEAVFVVRHDYTEKLNHAQYDGIVELYTAPSSQAAATVSEPLVSNTILYWIQEEAVARVRENRQSAGMPFTEETEAELRDTFTDIWEEGSSVTISTVELEEEEDVRKPWLTGGAAACARYFGMLAVFYIVVSAQWMCDLQRRGIRIRAQQRGTPLWRLFFAQGLAAVTVCEIGFALAGVACIPLGLGGGAIAVLPQMACYLFAVLCMTFFVTACINSPMALLFLAPVLTFTNAILSGLLTPLPAWGAVLQVFARALPGYWLADAMNNPFLSLPPMLLCAVIWMGLGLVIIGVKGRKKE